MATESFHRWDSAEIGTIEFAETGANLLTFHHGKGNNLANFELAPVEPASSASP